MVTGHGPASAHKVVVVILLTALCGGSGCNLLLPLPGSQPDAGASGDSTDSGSIVTKCDPQLIPYCEGPVQVHCSAAGELVRFDCRQGCEQGRCIQCIDQDHDQYGEGVGCKGPDCDDNDPQRNPDQDELCNNVDDNCNKTVDEGLTKSCSSLCGPGQQVCQGGVWLACDAPLPQQEVCDGKDNNCNGAIDEGVGTTYFQDLDHDTYGNDSVTVKACAPPPNHVTRGGDCNDNDKDVHPSQLTYFTTPSSGSGFDYNCDGAETKKNGGTLDCATYYQLHGTCAGAAAGWAFYVPACGKSNAWIPGCTLQQIGMEWYCTPKMSSSKVQSCH